MRNQDAPARALRSIEHAGWLILAIAASGSLILGGIPAAIGIATGGACALGSFRWMDVYFARLFRKEVHRPRWWHHLLYGLRFISLMGIVALAIGWMELPVVSVVIGLTIPPLAIFVHGAMKALRTQGSTRA